MKELEQRAREYRVENQIGVSPDDTIPVQHGVDDVREWSFDDIFGEGYLAGAVEVMRWRKCSEEMPKIGDQIILYYPLGDCRWSWCAGEVDGSDDGLFVDFEIDGQAIDSRCYWREIDPLPTTTDCKSEVG